MFNIVVLTGRLTADPELKTTSNGVAVTNFSIAVQRRYRSGEEAETDFINLVAWRQTAEFITKYFQKGSMIGVEGAIQTRKYVDKDTGKNRTAFEVVVNNAQFVESKKDNDLPAEDVKTPDSANFTTTETNSSDFEVVNDFDGDLPF